MQTSDAHGTSRDEGEDVADLQGGRVQKTECTKTELTAGNVQGLLIKYSWFTAGKVQISAFNFQSGPGLFTGN